MAKTQEKRTIKDSFPGVAYLDRDDLRDTFTSLREREESGSSHAVKRLTNGRFVDKASPARSARSVRAGSSKPSSLRNRATRGKTATSKDPANS